MPDETPFIDIINEQIVSGEIKLPAFNKTGMQVQQEAGKKNANIKKIEKLIKTLYK